MRMPTNRSIGGMPGPYRRSTQQITPIAATIAAASRYLKLRSMACFLELPEGCVIQYDSPQYASTDADSRSAARSLCGPVVHRRCPAAARAPDRAHAHLHGSRCVAAPPCSRRNDAHAVVLSY